MKPLNPMTLDYSDLGMVKKLADQMAVGSTVGGFTVILRQGMATYNIIHTENEVRLLRGALVVYRTDEES